MNNYEKLEYIHSYLQEVENGRADCGMLSHAMAFVEEIKQEHPAPWNDGKEPSGPWAIQDDYI